MCKKDTIRVLCEGNKHNVRVIEHVPNVITTVDSNEDTLHVGVDASIKNSIMAGHIEIRGYLLEWSNSKTIASNWNENTPYAAEARTMLEAMRMTKSSECVKQFKEITCMSDNKRLLKNVNKETPSVSDMTQDAGSMLAEIMHFMKPLKGKI